MKRPISVSIIAWFYVAYSVVTLLPKIFILTSPEGQHGLSELMSAYQHKEIVSVPLWFQVFFSYLASPVSMIAGILMLKGNVWGRHLITTWIPCALLLTLLVTGFSASFVAKLPFAAIVLFFLFRPVSSQYFKAEASN